MKKVSTWKLSLLAMVLLVSLNSSISATSANSTLQVSSNTIGPMAEPIENITKEFAKKMRDNAAVIAYYALVDQEQGTYPIGTGMEFANNVKTNGPWDYKVAYGVKVKYYFNNITTTGEDLGNMHYGYVGRAAGFGENLLKTAAGAYQIYSQTSSIKWYASYFDDPSDQAAIQRGFNYWTNNNLPQTQSFVATSEHQALIGTLSDEQKEEIEAKYFENMKKIRND